MRGGFIGPRPGMLKKVLSFDTGIETPFKSGGRFQHADFYDGNGYPALLSSHGGRLFHIGIPGFEVTEITPSTGPNSSTQPIGWSTQAENYWIYQDNQSYPIIFNGASSRRSNPMRSEVPVGNVMAYTMGRLVVALPDRQSFRVGDLVFGASGTPAFGYVDALLRFTENNYLNEGGDFVARVFGAPTNFGPILSMKANEQTNTSLGQGPLIVGTPNVVFTVQLPFDRTVWKNLAQALQTASPIKGPLGQRSTVSYNADLFYRALDGIRSYAQTNRQQQSTYDKTPISSELGDTLSFDTMSLLEHGSAAIFDRRLLMTISPVNSDMGVWHRGLVALDFNLSSGARKKMPPAWEDVWTGLRILQLVPALVDRQERLFIYALNSLDEIELWELDLDAKFDEGQTAIRWTLDFPSYNCGDSDNFKRLETARMVVDNLVGDLNVTLKYRTDLNPCWQPWGTAERCAAFEDCGPFDCFGPKTLREQQRTPIRFTMPPDTFDPINSHKYRTGYAFQPQLSMEGYCQIQSLRIYALDEPEQLGIDNRNPA